MDFRKSATTAIVIGFVGGAFLLGGALLGGSSGNASTHLVTTPKTQTPKMTSTPYIPDDGYLLATAMPTPADGNQGGGTLVPVNQPNTGGASGNIGGGNPGPQQPQPELPAPLQPQPEPQGPVTEPEPEAEDEGDTLQLAPPR